MASPDRRLPRLPPRRSQRRLPLQDAAVERAQRDHGPSAFAWPVAVSRSGKSIIFESIDHAGRRDRYLVRLGKQGNRVAVQRGVLPPLDPLP